MDLILDFADPLFLDATYEALAAALPVSPQTAAAHLLARDAVFRQTLSLGVLNAVGAIVLYLLMATASYYLIFDHDQMRHPKFLPNQVRREMALSLQSLPVMSALLTPFFVLEMRGHGKIYDNVSDYGWAYLLATVPFYLLFTDMCIYWIHRWEHHPAVYAYVHKPHHAWKVPTPFAAYAFHPLDGALQALPYHIFPLLFPLHKYLYLGLFLFVMAWTVFIHDGAYLVSGTFINGAAHHTVHHLEFNYNYGQYFTLWDKLGGSHKEPTAENTMPQKASFAAKLPSSASAKGVEKSGRAKGE
ncbi:c-5 sterol desaturase [Blastocladiella emersonii ATCC 22665]|nr:c-5 sterol desaturase [Blastocladiella emersonii ATCC 22665]